MSESEDPFAGVAWRSGFEFGLEGQGWPDLDPEFPASRLPKPAKDIVSEKIWKYSLHGNGLFLSFRTNAPHIFARWTLTDAVPEVSIAAGGLDCYGQDEFGNWHWVGRTTPWRQPHSDGGFNATPLDGKERLYRVYLPLGTPVTQLEIGVHEAFQLQPVAPREVKDGRGIAYYGTSIVYGAGVSRSGMAHTNLLGRWLDQPILNLGFPGLAKMEPYIADFLIELDPALFILDPLANMDVALIEERMLPFMRTLYRARPDTPVLWVGERIWTDAAFQPQRKARFTANQAAAEVVLKTMRDEGMQLTVLPGGELFGADHEGTCDGSHPTDLGSVRMARYLLPPIARLLAK